MELAESSEHFSVLLQIFSQTGPEIQRMKLNILRGFNIVASVTQNREGVTTTSLFDLHETSAVCGSKSRGYHY